MMVLVDTSVWIHHFRQTDPQLSDQLSEGTVLMHPCVAGELACGNLRDRRRILSYLGNLPEAICAGNEEVSKFIEIKVLWGKGLGWIDVSLLASALLTNCSLWTRDKNLHKAAEALGVAWNGRGSVISRYDCRRETTGSSCAAR